MAVVSAQGAGQTVAQLRGHPECPTHVLHRTGQPVGDPVADHRLPGAVRAPALLDPGQHLIAPGTGDVNVHVRHGPAARVKKSLEQQVVFDRIGQGDAQHVAENRTGCRSPACRQDAVFGAVVGDLGGTEKEAFQLQLLDGGEFGLQPDTRRLSLLAAVHGVQASLGTSSEIAPGIHPSRQLRLRRDQAFGPQVQVALLGQLRGVAQRVGVRQLPGPALRGAQVHGVVPGAVRVGHVHVDAQPGAAQGVEQRVLALVGQPDLRSGHAGQPVVPRHRPQEAEGAAHAWIGVVIQLHV